MPITPEPPARPPDEPPQSAPLTVEISQPEPSELHVTIAGELDLSNLPELADPVGAALAGAPQRLVVHAGGVRFADSSAISLWLQWSMSVPHFELRDPPVLLRAVITTMGLGEQLGVQPG
ncbi:MAG TPA: STAS domain-containing protein [Solirubrobacteraceae bacterium]|nr:STAS domain-containing protein [Solirubrobacteraceae bacterium]